MKSKTILITALSFLLCTTLNVHATDSCGGPYGPQSIKAPRGNIKNKSANHWITPIGGDSNWEAINYGDEDWNSATCQCEDDAIPDPDNIKWVSTYLTNPNMKGSSKTLTAHSNPHTSVGVSLQLDDAGNIINDGGFTTVASQNVDIVIPDKETHPQDILQDCAVLFPGTAPYGASRQYKGKVERNGYTLDFDHCQIQETSTWPGWTGGQNACNLTVPTIGGQTGLTSNTWDGVDTVRQCFATDNAFPNGCETTYSLAWSIRTTSGPGAWHNYHTPLYTFAVPVGGKYSDMDCSRAPLIP